MEKAFSMGRPLISMIRSPALNPALSAGLPFWTLLTSSQCSASRYSSSNPNSTELAGSCCTSKGRCKEWWQRQRALPT